MLWATGRVGIDFSGPGYFAWGAESGVENDETRDDGATGMKISDAVVTKRSLEVTITRPDASPADVRLYGVDGTLRASQMLEGRSGESTVTLATDGMPSGSVVIALEQEGRPVDVRTVHLVR